MSIFIQNLKQAFRNQRHNGWQTIISVVSLTVAIVSLTFSLNWLWTEMNYDWFRKDYKELYVLQRENNVDQSSSSYMSHKLTEQLDSLMGEYGTYAIYRPFSGKMEFYEPDNPDNSFLLNCMYATSDIVEVLGIKVISGSVEETLQTWDRFVITEGMAMRMYGRTDVVGEQILQKSGDQIWTYTVGAVIEDNPEVGTNFPYDMIYTLNYKPETENNWFNFNFHFLIRTQRPDLMKGILERMENPNNDEEYILTPLRFYQKMGEYGTFLDNYFYQIAFVVISVLLLLCAVVNLIMVYTSIFLGRIREYILRRCLGASDWSNVGWMLTELLPLLVLVLVCSVICMEWCVYGGVVPGVPVFLGRVFGVVVLLFIVLLLSGLIYPVSKLRRSCRRSFRGEYRKSHSHAWLLAVQCVACAFLLFVSLGMQRQISRMIHADMGFEHENMLRLYTGWQKDANIGSMFHFSDIFYDLPQEFQAESSCITDAIAMRADLFNRKTGHSIDIHTEEQHNNPMNIEGQSFTTYMEIPFRALEFFNIKVEDGDGFQPEDEREGEVQVLLTDKTMTMLDEKGYEGDWYVGDRNGNSNCMYNRWFPNHLPGSKMRIGGRVKLRLNDFHQHEDALMLVGIPERHTCFFVEHDAIYIKFEPGQREEAEAAVRSVLERHGVKPGQIYLNLFDDYLAETYEEDVYYANLLLVITVFSVFVTLSGVLSMLLYSLRIRRRSMAIRRVMGAGFRDLFRPHLYQYSAYVIGGCIVAYFPAVWIIDKWMELFFFNEEPGIGLMALILAGLLLVVVTVVYWKVRRCMNDRPMDVLQPES